MKKNIICILLFLFIISSAFSAPFSFNNSDKKVLVTITVDKKTENITQADLDAKIAEYKSAGLEGTSDEILEVLVNDKVFLMSAARDNIFVTDEEVTERMRALKQQFESQYGQSVSDEDFNSYLVENLSKGKSVEDYKKALKESLLVDKYLRAKKPNDLDTVTMPDEAEVKKFYRKNQTQFVNPEYVKVAHIYIPKTEPDAKANLEKVLADIKDGKISFEKAVMQYSKDTSSQKSGGDIGNITETNATILGEDFIDCVFDLEVGDISSQVIESPSGFHILKSRFHEYKKFLDIDDYISPDSSVTVREYIKKYLQNQKSQENYVKTTNDFVDELKKSARIIYTNKK